ncbi:hypothetical protein TIFTF001_010135 [Ficus carica]|uniref:Uncharacterized protein n=1 Tax=Ficus carica TaxID=3494 RepID=A0AA87ZWH1_FICCA|nr:hypothetical protein TIFTF001_010135 [Ficus carica]
MGGSQIRGRWVPEGRWRRGAGVTGGFSVEGLGWVSEMGVVGRNRIGGEGAWVVGSWSIMKGLLPAAYPCPIQVRTPTCSSGGGGVQCRCRHKNNSKLLLRLPSPPAADSSVVPRSTIIGLKVER